jgi:hypothetical protein
MSSQEVAKLVCEAHTRAVNDERGFTVGWGAPPDFTRIDGDVYWEAWRVLREWSRSAS